MPLLEKVGEDIMRLIMSFFRYFGVSGIGDHFAANCPVELVKNAVYVSELRD